MTGGELEVIALEGIEFVLDNRPGKDRGKSSANRFVLVKTPEFVSFYRNLATRKFSAILELGMFEGGSLVYFDKLFHPDKIVGIDIRRQPIEPLEEYRKIRPHVETHYGLSQSDDALDPLLRQKFPNGIDLIVDDASHLYELTKRSFELCFPHLNAGGLYIIEDWSWAHKAPYQQDTHPWFRKPALTNLVFELTLLTTCTPWISAMTVLPDMVVVHKSTAHPQRPSVSSYSSAMRGKVIGLI
ncbi:MAG: class I SAM-dependent methyltransferase [Hyphomicrobiales bacterium]